jgi:N-acetylmuramoyl-L-alanine amidase
MICSRRIAIVSLAAVLSLLSLGASWAETPGNSSPKSTGAGCARANFRVVLDVGHTADSPGAMSARGVNEYDFNLRLAKQIDRTLVDAGFAKTVLMITGGPGKRSMYERMARANNMSADLLLSIHHDSVPNPFLEKWEYEGKPASFSDRFKGHSIFVSDGNGNPKASILFGHLLGDQLKARGLQYTPHYTEKFMGRYQRSLLDTEAGVYRYDTLFVLKKSRMPAVLLEAGSIINRDEELLMASPERQLQISAAVADAVESFCMAQSSQHSPQIAQSVRSLPKLARVKPRHRHKRVAGTASVATFFQPSADLH